MGTTHGLPPQPSVGQIKTPVQCEENPTGSGGMIINDQDMFTMNKQHLVPVLPVRGEKLWQTSFVVAESEDNKTEMPPKTLTPLPL